MDKIELLLNEVKNFPEPLLDEVLDFVQFLKTKIVMEKIETVIACESSLKKDWLRPEEDDAWQDLQKERLLPQGGWGKRQELLYCSD